MHKVTTEGEGDAVEAHNSFKLDIAHLCLFFVNNPSTPDLTDFKMWEDKENSDDEEADFVRYGHIDDDIGKPVAGSFCRTHSLDNIFYTYSVDDTGDTTYMIEMNNYGTVI